MCDPGTLTIVAAAASVAGTITETVASYQQAKYEQSVARQNQAAENERARDAMLRGDKEAEAVARKSGALIGQQRAAMAANGVDVSFGSAADIMADTAMFAREDQVTVRENTKREVRGFDINASNFGGQAKAAKSRASAAVISGALKTVSTVAGAAQRYQGISASSRGAA